MRCLPILVLLFLSTVSVGQIEMPDGRLRVLANVVDGDTIPLIHLAPAEVFATLSPEAAEKIKAFNKLRRDVLKAYPYARLAADKLKYINDSVARIPNEKARKRFIKATEDEMKAQFEKDLRKLTFTQGRILIKLVDRETGRTSYSLVKDLRGSFQAFFWQSLARLFGANLKSEYKPEDEDLLIESIVQQIERGELQYRAVVK
ncbi:MAG: DUF4294 domain-containing protein [Bacteroidota bacterium]